MLTTAICHTVGAQPVPLHPGLPAGPISHCLGLHVTVQLEHHDPQKGGVELNHPQLLENLEPH